MEEPQEHQVKFEDFNSEGDIEKQIEQYLIAVQWDTKKIGKITLRERQKKIQRYTAKRDRRQWEKKISYDCRKVVADKRLRIKGRFIRKEEQMELLKMTTGNDDLDQANVNHLK